MKPVRSVKLGGIGSCLGKFFKEGNRFSQQQLIEYKVGENWKKTNSLRNEDLPKAILALQEAYHFVSLKDA